MHTVTAAASIVTAGHPVVETATDAIGVAGALVLCAIGVLHIAWAAGVRWGSASVIPTVDGRPTLRPSRFATLVVAFLLLLAADLYVGAADGRSPHVLFRVGSVGVGLVLLARAIGDRRTVGLTKQVKDTAFARLDTRWFTPLCLALSAAGFLVATH